MTRQQSRGRGEAATAHKIRENFLMSLLLIMVNRYLLTMLLVLTQLQFFVMNSRIRGLCRCTLLRFRTPLTQVHE